MLNPFKSYVEEDGKRGLPRLPVPPSFRGVAMASERRNSAEAETTRSSKRMRGWGGMFGWTLSSLVVSPLLFSSSLIFRKKLRMRSLRGGRKGRDKGMRAMPFGLRTLNSKDICLLGSGRWICSCKPNRKNWFFCTDLGRLLIKLFLRFLIITHETKNFPTKEEFQN